jgi:pimeloyl-ACP methyl ester carboxylesterase
MALIRIKDKISSPNLNVDEGGSGGLPVMFVHSLAGNTRHWSAQLEHLRKDRRAVALDIRGHGNSESPKDGNFAIESMASDIGAVADELGLQRFVLVGHSSGGTVAIAYAGSHQEKVAGLLLADPSGDVRKVPAEQANLLMGALESDSYSKAIEDYYGMLLTGSQPAVREKVIEDLRNTPRETVIGIFKSSLRHDPLTPLQLYKGPKLSVVTSLNDAPFSLHNLDTDLPHIQVTGTGHWLQNDKPEEFNRILDDFLTVVESNEKI